MDDLKLYCFAESGNCNKAALMLNCCGLEWQPIFVDFFNGETRSPSYRETVNAQGEAPVLVHKGRKFSQSGVILQYLADETGKFYTENKDEQYEILRWLLFDNHKFTSYIGTHRFLLEFMKTGETPVTEFLAGRIAASLQIVDKHLDGRDFVATAKASIADLSMCGYLYYGKELGFELAPYKNITAWLARIASLEGWVPPYELMPRSRDRA